MAGLDYASSPARRAIKSAITSTGSRPIRYDAREWSEETGLKSKKQGSPFLRRKYSREPNCISPCRATRNTSIAITGTSKPGGVKIVPSATLANQSSYPLLEQPKISLFLDSDQFDVKHQRACGSAGTARGFAISKIPRNPEAAFLSLDHQLHPFGPTFDHSI